MSLLIWGCELPVFEEFPKRPPVEELVVVFPKSEVPEFVEVFPKSPPELLVVVAVLFPKNEFPVELVAVFPKRLPPVEALFPKVFVVLLAVVLLPKRLVELLVPKVDFWFPKEKVILNQTNSDKAFYNIDFWQYWNFGRDEISFKIEIGPCRLNLNWSISETM